MLEKMKKCLSALGVLAAAYLPPGFKEVLLQMAAKTDDFENRLQQLEQKVKNANTKID